MKQTQRMHNLWSEPLCHTQEVSADWDVTVSSKILSITPQIFTVNICLGQAIKARSLISHRSGQESNGSGDERSPLYSYSIMDHTTWYNRSYVLMETYVCKSSHCLKLVSGISLWLVHLLLYPLQIKSASCSSLWHASCSNGLQVCTYSRTKRHWGMFWIRQKYAFPCMLWIILKIFIFAHCLCIFWPLS